MNSIIQLQHAPNRQGGDKSASIALDGFNASLRRFKMDAGMADRIDDWLALLGTFRYDTGIKNVYLKCETAQDIGRHYLW